MNFRRTIVIVVVAIMAVMTWFYLRPTGNRKSEDAKITVATTYYPLYDIARNVAGNRAVVSNLTPAGAEPHDYEPAPKTLVMAREADVFIYNGGNFEPWTGNFLKSYRSIAVQASRDLQLRAGNDPHFWLDPVLAKKIVESIHNGLVEADPASEDYFASRAAAYMKRLDDLDAAFRQGLATCKKEVVISSHDAFGYVAARYDFTVEPIAGINPEEEPSPSRLAELSRLVRSQGLTHVFFERLVSPRLADTIAQETGAETLVFDPIEGLTSEDQKKGKDYLSIQQENLRALRTALACQ